MPPVGIERSRLIAVPNTNSHRSGWTERVKRSSWSWRSLRHSVSDMAAVPAAIRRSGPPASAAGRRGSAEAAGDAALGADIAIPPLVGDDVTGDRAEDVLQAPVAPGQQFAGRAERDDPPAVHDREPVAVALGLLH